MTSTTTDARRLGRAGRLACVVALSLALGACETSFTMSDLNPFGSSEPQPCPPGSPLADAVQLAEFGRAKSQSANNVVYTAQIERAAFDCEVLGDRVTGRLSLTGTVELGRKGKAGDLSLPIFVAVAHNDAEVVSKQFNTVEVTVPRGEKEAQFQKTVQDFSFQLGGRPTLEFDVLIGFNLTPEQVEYNRKQLGG